MNFRLSSTNSVFICIGKHMDDILYMWIICVSVPDWQQDQWSECLRAQPRRIFWEKRPSESSRGSSIEALKIGLYVSVLKYIGLKKLRQHPSSFLFYILFIQLFWNPWSINNMNISDRSRSRPLGLNWFYYAKF